MSRLSFTKPSYRKEQRRFPAPSNPRPKALRRGCKAALSFEQMQLSTTPCESCPILSCRNEDFRAIRLPGTYRGSGEPVLGGPEASTPPEEMRHYDCRFSAQVGGHLGTARCHRSRDEAHRLLVQEPARSSGRDKGRQTSLIHGRAIVRALAAVRVHPQRSGCRGEQRSSRAKRGRGYGNASIRLPLLRTEGAEFIQSSLGIRRHRGRPNRWQLTARHPAIADTCSWHRQADQEWARLVRMMHGAFVV